MTGETVRISWKQKTKYGSDVSVRVGMEISCWLHCACMGVGLVGENVETYKIGDVEVYKLLYAA